MGHHQEVRDADFEGLYVAHAPGLFAFIAQRTGDRSLAEDLLGATFERALRARRRFDHKRGSAKSWIYSIALNLVRDEMRRRAAEGRALARTGVQVASAESAGALAAVEARDTIRTALDVLSQEEREAIALRYGADLTVPEIAKLLGEPLARVEGRVYRALRKLRAQLAG